MPMWLIFVALPILYLVVLGLGVAALVWICVDEDDE
jgi:hypothetical protein